MIQPPATAIEIHHKLLGSIFIARIVEAKLFNSPAVARGAAVSHDNAPNGVLAPAHAGKSHAH